MRKERSNIQLGSFGNERIWWISQVTRDISFCVAHLSTSKCRVFGIPVTSSHRNDNCASQAWICRLWSISWRLLHCTHWLLWVCREKDFQEQYLWAGHASHILQRGLVLASHIQSHLRHQQTNFGLRMRIDTSQSFWKAVNHVFEAEDLLYWLLKKLLLWTWIWWVGVSTTLYQATLQC